MNTVKLFSFNSTTKPRKEQFNFIKTWALYIQNNIK